MTERRKKFILCLYILVIGMILSVAVLNYRGEQMLASGARITSSLSNLKQIYHALQAYAYDHGGDLPPMDTIGHLKSALYPKYCQYEYTFVSPTDRAPYKTNQSLSCQKLTSISSLSSTVVLYEAHATQRVRGFGETAHLGRCVLFANGRVGWMRVH